MIPICQAIPEITPPVPTPTIFGVVRTWAGIDILPKTACWIGGKLVPAPVSFWEKPGLLSLFSEPPRSVAVAMHTVLAARMKPPAAARKRPCGHGSGPRIRENVEGKKNKRRPACFW